MFTFNIFNQCTGAIFSCYVTPGLWYKIKFLWIRIGAVNSIFLLQKPKECCTVWNMIQMAQKALIIAQTNAILGRCSPKFEYLLPLHNKTTAFSFRTCKLFPTLNKPYLFLLIILKPFNYPVLDYEAWIRTHIRVRYDTNTVSR